MRIAKVVVFLADNRQSRDAAQHIQHFLQVLGLSTLPTVDCPEAAEDFIRTAGSIDDNLYLLQINQATLSDPGFAVASYLRRRSRLCQIAVIVPELTVLRQVTEAILLPGYVFTPMLTDRALELYIRRMVGMACGNQGMLSVPIDGQTIRLEIENVVCCTMQEHRVVIQTTNGSYAAPVTLTALEQKLPGNFVRAARGVLINLRYLERVDRANGQALLQGGITVPLSHRGASRLEDIALHLDGVS